MKRSSALLRRTPLKRTRLRVSARTRERHVEKNRETAEIYRQVEKRAKGRCECGCGIRFGTGEYTQELDHFWGRKNAPQSVENCWLLIRKHHRAKGGYRPSWLHWLLLFAVHVLRHGYVAEDAKVREKIEAEKLDKQVDAAGRALREGSAA